MAPIHAQLDVVRDIINGMKGWGLVVVHLHLVMRVEVKLERKKKRPHSAFSWIYFECSSGVVHEEIIKVVNGGR